MAFSDFINYIDTTFFQAWLELPTGTFRPTGTIIDFRESLFKPLRKTLRLNYTQVNAEEFITRKSLEGWTFTPTPNPRAYRIDRTDTSTALGSTPEHLRGDFYIQELSASMAVHILTNGETSYEPLRILEMAASPGGKTTQLAEHYPASFIVANEFTKDRLNALLDNIERMRCLNIGVSGLNGIQFGYMPESFDRVLLDAPCSGEGIGFKAEESLKYWNIKNVHKIARLQSKLLIAGLITLRTGGELLYSTCTLNTIENEWVLESARAKFWDAIDITYQKRYWPHVEIAGGFFVAKIRKVRAFETSLPRVSPGNNNISLLSKKEFILVAEVLKTSGLPKSTQYQLYKYKNEVRYIWALTPIDDLLSIWYCLRLGVGIGHFSHETYVPNLKVLAHLITWFDQE